MQICPFPYRALAMQRCSDTLLAFTLRAVELVIANQSRTDREMLRRLCDILNNPHLIPAVPHRTPHLDRNGSQLGQHPRYGAIRRYGF
jgi:hypothetical protein